MGLPLDVTDSPPFNYVAHTGPTNTFVAVELNVPYAVCEILIAIGAIFGNGLVIIAFVKERKLRKLTNYYIVSLAVADLLVGLFAIPFAILASVGLPPNLQACLFTLSILMVLFTISIFSLMAVSIDRYWAILYPMEYSRDVHTKTAISIIGVCWVAGILLGFLPLLGWNTGKMNNHSCMFRTIMDYNYLVFLYFATAVLPALLIAAFYVHIYRIIIKQRQQIIAMNPSEPGGGSIVRHLSVHHGGLGDNHRQTTRTVLCRPGAVRKREIKAIQNLFSIVIFFIVCWFPLHTVNCVIAFCPRCKINDFLINFCIVLSHINSVGNPFLYAYHLKDFRIAIKKFIWRFVFRHSDIKFNTVSVIYDRNFLVGSQRQLQRFSGFDRPRSQKQSSLHQVDGSRRMDGVYFENHVSSIQVKETHQNASNIDIEVESAVLSNSTANKQTSEEELINDHGTCLPQWMCKR